MPSRSQFETNEEYNAYFRDYRLKNIDKARKYGRKYNKKWRKEHGYINEIIYRERHPEKIEAQTKLRIAVKKGIVKKLPCEVCKSENSQGHHPDYTKPLEVIWLCAVHHTKTHREMLISAH